MVTRLEYNAETGETTVHEFTPEPNTEPVVFPLITARQIRLMLLQMNVTEDDVDALLANDPAGLIEWKHASMFKRTHPLVDQLAMILELPPLVVDMAWRDAEGFN